MELPGRCGDWLDTATVTVQGSCSGSTRRARGEDFYLATNGDFLMATCGDFLMATDIVGTMRLEDERLTRRQCPKALAAGTPEVDLVQIWTGAQELVPTRIGNTHEGPHGASVGTGGPPVLKFARPGTLNLTPESLRSGKLTKNPRREGCRGARGTVRKPVDEEAPSDARRRHELGADPEHATRGRRRTA